MNPMPLIRDERSADIDAITAVTTEAFKTLDISDGSEPGMVLELRRSNALAVSLVAELDHEIVGHVAFSRVEISDGTHDWYTLGPVSVLPKLHRQGIGKALIEAGLERLKSLGAAGCCVVGHLEYYPKFGFQNVSELVYEGIPQEYFFALAFDGKVPSGSVTFHEALQEE